MFMLSYGNWICEAFPAIYSKAKESNVFKIDDDDYGDHDDDFTCNYQNIKLISVIIFL